MQNKRVDINFFPGFTRKSVTFTIDDGNIPMDTKFLEIVRPAGILGTFNLCSHWMDKMSPEEYREFYRGYEIANHCKYHPQVFSDTMRFKISDEKFDPMGGEDYTGANPVVYKTGIEDELYILHGNPKNIRPRGWSNYCTADNYIRHVESGRRELEEIFGEGTVTSFVYPYGRQGNTKVREYLYASDYYAVRKTGTLLDSTGFAMPEDRKEWTYNATHSSLLPLMEIYENYPDDGSLKFFSFGVHSVDFETGNKWDDLKTFAEKYGNRPSEFYYATVRDIMAQEDAIKVAEVTESEIVNNSDLTLFALVDGERVEIAPRETYTL